jgi:hypothetical protein
MLSLSACCICVFPQRSIGIGHEKYGPCFPTNPIPQNLIVSLREIIEKVDWMAPDTRKAALAKLDSFGVKVGYPDKWIDYTDLRLDDRDTFVAVVRKLSEFEHYRHVAIGGFVRVSNSAIGQLPCPLPNSGPTLGLALIEPAQGLEEGKQAG